MPRDICVGFAKLQRKVATAQVPGIPEDSVVVHKFCNTAKSDCATRHLIVWIRSGRTFRPSIAFEVCDMGDKKEKPSKPGSKTVKK